ncbi:hypothetical protein SAMN04488503_2988 [Humidesulfovibrio mexicanus]|uniref:Uncharacterized protein n=1 Tax=Humidesulfovibrio mexicanus TaxID=147047 RepID=A0A239C8H5_9BACT|nr:hypothetical protein [Humidesulfovibrio mexicanus]SNS15958.1 hypothetical protein SAMN04488503_2988 [Humidesulfovibrio mexicanus]
MSNKMPSRIYVTHMVCSTPLAQIVEVRVPGDLHPDTRALVRRFAEALAKKLLASEIKYGYGNGWKDPGCVEELRGKLAEHVAKGDPVDVAAFCAMLWHHGEHCRPHTRAEAVEAERDALRKALQLKIQHPAACCPGAAGCCPEASPEPGCILARAVIECWISAGEAALAATEVPA